MLTNILFEESFKYNVFFATNPNFYLVFFGQTKYKAYICGVHNKTGSCEISLLE